MTTTTDRPSSPTLLVFTRGPAADRARRRLLPSRLAPYELALHRRCLEAALEAGRRCGLALTVTSPRPLDLPAGVRRLPQRGAGFGERLRAAVRQAAPADGHPLLVVGSDVPGLRAAHLREALEHLRRDPGAVVLGPSPDGGLYLLAAARPLDSELGAVRWCRRDTLASLLAALAAAGRRAVLLAPLADLDHRRDLEGWLAGRGPESPLWRRLLRALAKVLAELRRPPVPPDLARARPAPLPVLSGRAPPA